MEVAEKFLCPECGARVRRKPGRGKPAHFCSAECRIGFNTRAAAQGRAVIALAKAWRQSRNRVSEREVGKKALSELSSMLDLFNAEDAQAGRPRATTYAERLLKEGRYIDRRRA